MLHSHDSVVLDKHEKSCVGGAGGGGWCKQYFSIHGVAKCTSCGNAIPVTRQTLGKCTQIQMLAIYE